MGKTEIVKASVPEILNGLECVARTETCEPILMDCTNCPFNGDYCRIDLIAQMAKALIQSLGEEFECRTTRRARHVS